MPTSDFKTAITATLSVRRWAEAMDFYKAAFGAAELYRVPGGGLQTGGRGRREAGFASGGGTRLAAGADCRSVRASLGSWQAVDVSEAGALFVVDGCFVVRGRGTALSGRHVSRIRDRLSVGDHIELRFPDGRRLRHRVVGIECFHVSPPQADPPFGVMLADEIGDVPQGTTVYLAQSGDG